ncbi:MAG: MarR family transcriptional regulator [Anaerolineaceae bacterium]|nr:MarR family transcriptional regulator [Anaerolineaceae bacterium]
MSNSKINTTPELDGAAIQALMNQGQESLARLTLQLNRQFSGMAAQRYAALGYAGLTPVHTFLMANLDINGTRIVTIAERMGTTKQFAGRLVQELERKKYLEVKPDPTDRRAAVVKATHAGWKFFADACAIKNEIEAEYAALVGADHMAIFAAVLEKLAAYNPQNADTSDFPGPESQA